MVVKVPYAAQRAGYPGQWNDSIEGVLEGIIVGETPAVVTRDMKLATGSYKTYQPVTLDDVTGLCSPAEAGTPATGIVLHDIEVATDGVGVGVLIVGCLNLDIVAWDASYTTDDAKLTAFDGAPSPTQIVVKRARFGSVVPAP